MAGMRNVEAVVILEFLACDNYIYIYIYICCNKLDFLKCAILRWT